MPPIHPPSPMTTAPPPVREPAWSLPRTAIGLLVTESVISSVVLGLSVDDTDDKLKPFARELQMNYPVLVGLGRDDVQDAFGPIWGIPTTFLISREGKICRKNSGVQGRAKFEREIKALL